MFLALVEYFVVLFGMRYDKHWRHKKDDLDRGAGDADNHGPSKLNMSSLFGSNKVHAATGNNTAVVVAENANLVGACAFTESAKEPMCRWGCIR